MHVRFKKFKFPAWRPYYKNGGSANSKIITLHRLGFRNLNFPRSGHIEKWRRRQLKNNLRFKNLNFPRGGHIGKWRPAPIQK
jgi:hypothetical protein